MELDTNNFYNDLSTKFANLGATRIVGAYAANVAVPSHDSNIKRITFNSNFKQKPYVCATIEHEWVNVLHCTITYCTVSGVNIKVYNDSTQNMNDILVHVIAVGYI